MIYLFLFMLLVTAFSFNCLMDVIAFHKSTSALLKWINKTSPLFYDWLVGDGPGFNGWHVLKGAMFGLMGISFFLLQWKVGVIYFISWAIGFTGLWKLLKIFDKKRAL